MDFSIFLGSAEATGGCRGVEGRSPRSEKVKATGSNPVESMDFSIFCEVQRRPKVAVGPRDEAPGPESSGSPGFIVQSIQSRSRPGSFLVERVWEDPPPSYSCRDSFGRVSERTGRGSRTGSGGRECISSAMMIGCGGTSFGLSLRKEPLPGRNPSPVPRCRRKSINVSTSRRCSGESRVIFSSSEPILPTPRFSAQGFCCGKALNHLSPGIPPPTRTPASVRHRSEAGSDSCARQGR